MPDQGFIPLGSIAAPIADTASAPPPVVAPAVAAPPEQQSPPQSAPAAASPDDTTPSPWYSAFAAKGAPKDWSQIYDDAAHVYGVDPNLLRSLVTVESHGNRFAVSNQGAKGPAQFIDSTAKAEGVRDPTDPWQAIFGAARLLRQNYEHFNGNPELAVAAYHGGTNPNDWGPKTQDYVRKIEDVYGSLSKPPPKLPADQGAAPSSNFIPLSTVATPATPAFIPLSALAAPVGTNPVAKHLVDESTFGAGPDQSQIGADVRAAAQGALTGTGAAISAVGEAARTGIRAAQPFMAGLFDKIDNGETLPPDLAPQVKMAVHDYQEGTAQTRQQLRGMYATAATEAAQPTSVLERAGQAVTGAGDAIQVDPRKEGFQTNVARSVGGLLPLAAAGAAAGPVGAALAIGGQSFNSAYDAAKQKGMSDDAAASYAYKDAGVQSALMAAPVARVMQSIPAPLRDGFAKTLINIGRHGLEFSGFNALSTFAHNFVTKQTIDPTQPLTQGLGQSVAEGAVAGMVFPTGAAALRGVGRTGAAVARAVHPAASPEFRAKMSAIEQQAGQTPAGQPAPAPPGMPEMTANAEIARLGGEPTVPEPLAATPVETPVPAAAVPPEAPAAAQPATAPAAPIPPAVAAATVGAGFTMVDPAQLTLDAKRFQFKGAADEKGVTGALAGNARWEPALANPITAWQGNDGNLYVVNGHQRTDLALRAQAAGQADVQVPTRVFSEADGYTPEFMRALGAYQNIAEGTGTSIDAAKVLRGASSLPDTMRLPDLPPRSALFRDATGLAQLSRQAFGMVENGVVPPEHAALVGAAIHDPTEQVAALDVLRRGRPATAEQARIMVSDIQNSGFLQGSQTSLFGDEQFAQSLLPERAQVLDSAMGTLRRNKGVFRAAVEGEDTLSGAGNVLDREGNVQGRTDNERLLDTLQRNATTRGPISDALTASARDLAAGKSRALVSADFLTKARRLVAGGSGEGGEAGGDTGGAGHEAAPGPVETPTETPRTEEPEAGPSLFGPEEPAATEPAHDELAIPPAPPERSPEQAAEEAGVAASQIVEHVTRRGRTLRGVVRDDLTKDQAQAIDPYTFKKGDGWFIREDRAAEAPPTEEAPASTGFIPLENAADPEAKPVAAPEAPAEAPRPEAPPAYGAANTFFTADAAERARAVLRAKFGGQLNSGFDPELALAGLTLAGFHVEAGARKFADFSHAMVADMGNAVRPHLKSWYGAVRDHPGFDNAGMSSAAEVENDLRQAQDNGTPLAEADHGVQDTVRPGDAGAGAEDVHAAPAGGQDRGPLAGEEQRGPRDATPDTGVGAEGPVRPPEYAGEAGGGGDGQGNLDRVPGAGGRAEAGATGRPPRPDDEVVGTDYRITPGEIGEDRGRTTKARDNLSAIELAKRLIEEDRPATREEQAILAKYVGWGGLSGAFHNSKGVFGKGLEQVGARLKEILTPEEHATAARSTQYAHYTAEHVIRSMWDAVDRLGFKGGMTFEPGMGIGHFRGMMPPDLADRSSYQGVEMDHLTASIAKLLYPESGVRQADFTRMPVPENTFDLVIGNPPFSDTVIKADAKYAARNFMLHDYFFAKSLDSVRPGGLLAFVTSAGTMNKVDPAAREYMAQRAEFVGGVRLPSTAFKQNAGTEVTTDVLFFKKRQAPVDLKAPEAAGHEAWTGTMQRKLLDAEGNEREGNVSRYFSEHPEMVLGKEGFFDKLYKGRYGVHAEPGRDLPTDLQEAIRRLPADVMEAQQTPEDRARLDFESGQKKEGSFYLDAKGALMQLRDGAGRLVPKRGAGVGGFTPPEMDRIRHMIPVRDGLRDVLRHDLAEDDAKAAAARVDLNRHYDAFVAKFGPINTVDRTYRRPTIVQQERARLEAREDARMAGAPFLDGDFDPTPFLARKASLVEIARARQAARDSAAHAGKPFEEGTFDPEDMPDLVIEKRPNIAPFMGDPESYRLRSIEDYDDNTGVSAKKEIFDRNILTRETAPKLDSAADGVLWSLNKFGRLDLDQVAAQMGKPRDQIITELGDKVFRVPGTHDTYLTDAEYLSGDVVSKLETARTIAESDPSFERNVQALEAALPAPLPPSEITMTIGMPWIPAALVRQFARDHLKIGTLQIAHIPEMGMWKIEQAYDPRADVSGRNQYGIDDRSADKLLSDAMNRTPPRIYKTVYEGGAKRSVFDDVATQAAQDRVSLIKQEFQGWLEADPARHADLADLYNAKLNRTVARVYDGAYLTTPGVAATWKWRPHQTRVVARIVQSGSTYMAHAVGAGKTSAMIGAGMEMRRLGLARKILYTIPNHMLGQFTKEFYEQYPTARIMVADEERFHTGRRKQFVADAAQDDLDAIIITHSGFGKIPVSDEFQAGLIQEELDRLNQTLADLDPQKDRITVKNLEGMKEKLAQRLAAAGTKDKDQTNTFEEMGVDFAFVDEAHMFRKLSLATAQSNVKGISANGSDKAWDLYTKLRYLESRSPGRSAVLASGTPITNTMGELYTVSRYLQPQALAARGISHFDSWSQMFGDTAASLEAMPDGSYKPVTRFSRFVNLPELFKMVGEVMDVVTPAQLEQYVTRPTIKGGERTLHLAPFTEQLADYQATLAARMKAIAERKGKVQKGDDILLSVINDGRHAAIDPRFVMNAPSDPSSKLNLMVDNIARVWRETKNQQFYDPADGFAKKADRGPATQMVFANLGVNGRGPMGFSAYQWIRTALARHGIPANEVAFIGDYKGHVQRQSLFNDMNEGKVRILVGSTQKMGTGVNAQRRLYAVHNMDPLWYPADDEQRVGRILRQGNMNPEIEVHDYTTTDTYDRTMWGMMGRKARFIEQFFRGDPDLREMEDLGEASTYEQAAAMATSDPRAFQLTEMRQALDTAKRRESAHNRNQYELRTRLQVSQDSAERYGRTAAAIEADIAQRQDTKGDQFRMTVAGEVFAKRKDAAAALGDAIKERGDGLGKNRETTIGQIGGFPLVLERGSGDSLYLTLKANGGRRLDVQHGGDPLGSIQSAETRLRGLDADLAYVRRSKADAEKTAESVTPLIGQPFTGGAEIDRLGREIGDLEASLAPAENKLQPGGLAERKSHPTPGKLKFTHISKYVTSVPVEFKKNTSIARGSLNIDHDGNAIYEGPNYPDSTDIDRAVQQYIAPFGPDTFVRASNNPDDYEHLKRGTHRGSTNHARGDTEGGVSASYTAEFPAKYMYLITGKRIGSGTDGEPLFDTKSVKVVSKRMTQAQFQKAERDATEKRKKELGLSDEAYRALVSGHKSIHVHVADEAPGGVAERKGHPTPGQADLLGAAAPKGRAAPAEDRQAVMPGMEPSATQAQAARDQAGRGALLPHEPQRPADEGLFAKPEAPQPGLPLGAKAEVPEPRLGSAGKDFVAFARDHAFLPADEAAAAYVLDRGRASGTEHLAGYDPHSDSVVLAHGGGSDSWIGFPAGLKAALDDPTQAMVVHHNHPRSLSLSLPDLENLAYPGISHVVAHGHDGAFYSASAGKLMGSTPGFAAKGDLLRRNYDGIAGRVRAALSGAVRDGRITNDEYGRLYGDIVNRALHEVGVIDYMTSAGMAEHLRPVAQQTLESALNGRPDVRIHRPAFAVSSAEGLAAIRAQTGSAARAQRSADQELPGAGPGVHRGAPGQPAPQEPPQGRLLEEKPKFLPIPASDAEAHGRIARLPVIGRAAHAIAEHALDFGHTLQMMATPMARGTVEARALTKDFANTMRLARWEGTRITEWLGKAFDRDQLRAMWDRADEQGVAMQRGEPTDGIGLDQLSDRERGAVEALQGTNRTVFEQAQKLGMIESEGLPSYVPRMAVEMTHGIASPLRSDGRAHNLQGIGYNVRTSTAQLRQRKHLTAEETERAAKAATDNPNATVVRDIRTLSLATMRLQEAVAGRTLINSIKEAGRQVGDAFVHEGAVPADSPFKWFTIEQSPAFWTWKPRFTTDEAGKVVAARDQDGNIIFDRVPIYVRADFEGPLRAVLSEHSGKLYGALMNLKGRMMTGIMYGVAHLGVIVGRSLPAMEWAPWGPRVIHTIQTGNVLKNDAAFMRRMIKAGLTPIGHQFGQQDISGILNAPDIAPGRSWTSKLIAAIPGLYSKDAGEATKRGIDRLGDFMHNTLLWDRVADIQAGLAGSYERHMLGKGLAPDTAARAAAHFANRYAGAMPNEAMSNAARKIANMVLFSRTYRLGNLGAMKDTFTGLPRDVLSQIERDRGVQEMLKAKSASRRAAAATMAIDLALYYVGNSLIQSGANVILGQSSASDEEKGYLRRLGEQGAATLADPLRALDPFGLFGAISSLGENEPEKRNRILIGFEKDGTGIYMRNPFGKYAEDLTDYLTKPLATLKSMLSPYARPIYALLANDIGFGKHLYDPNTTAEPSSVARGVADFVGLTLTGMTPNMALGDIKKLATGQGGAFEAGQIAGGALGFSVSHGYPGGPGAAEMSQASMENEFQVSRAMPGIRAQIKGGDIHGAVAAMTALKMPVSTQRYIIVQTEHPHYSAGQLKKFMRTASPERVQHFEQEQQTQRQWMNPTP